MKLNVKAFAITAGLLWGLGLFFITWWIILFDKELGHIPFISDIFRGYDVSITGSFIGLAWGLVCGAIIGALFALIYNYFQSK